MELQEWIAEIESYKFVHRLDLVEEVIPDRIEKIGRNAFQGCTNLSYLDTGNGIKVIEESTFDGCSNLRSVVVGRNVGVIGEGAFSGCISLRKIRIEGTLKDIGSRSFNQCHSLSFVECNASTRTTLETVLGRFRDEVTWVEI